LYVTNADLQAWWPELATLVVDLRRAGHVAVADLLIDAVEAGATSGEILSGVGVVLSDHRPLRSQLGEPAASAWDAVVTDVERAYPGGRLGNRLARAIKRRM
jgi:hypothetical protein